METCKHGTETEDGYGCPQCYYEVRVPRGPGDVPVYTFEQWTEYWDDLKAIEMEN